MDGATLFIRQSLEGVEGAERTLVDVGTFKALDYRIEKRYKVIVDRPKVRPQSVSPKGKLQP